MVGLEAGDVGARHHEVVDGPGLGELERVVHAPALDVIRLPVGGVVPVRVVPSDRVLVDESVPVVVDPLLPQDDPVAHLAGGHRLHDARVQVADPMRPLAGDVLADRLDLAVPVQVVGPVLVEEAVAVRIHGDVAGAGAASVPVEEVVAAVGVHRGDDVEDALVHHARDLLDAPVVLHEVPDGVERHLRALDLVAVDVGLDGHGGLVHLLPRPGVVDGHDPHVPASEALPHGLEGEEVGPGPLHEP